MVAAPITSGDTAFRSARLITADFSSHGSAAAQKAAVYMHPVVRGRFCHNYDAFRCTVEVFRVGKPGFGGDMPVDGDLVYPARNGKNMFIVLFPAVS